MLVRIVDETPAQIPQVEMSLDWGLEVDGCRRAWGESAHLRRCGTTSKRQRAIHKRGTGIEEDSEVGRDARAGCDSDDHWCGWIGHRRRSTGNSPNSTENNPRNSLRRTIGRRAAECVTATQSRYCRRRLRPGALPPWDNGSFGSSLFPCRPGARTPLPGGGALHASAARRIM